MHTVLVLVWLNCFGLACFLSFPKHIFKMDHELSAKSHWGHSRGLAAIRCCVSQTTKPGSLLRLYSEQVAYRRASQTEMWPLACANLANLIHLPKEGQGIQNVVEEGRVCFCELLHKEPGEFCAASARRDHFLSWFLSCIGRLPHWSVLYLACLNLKMNHGDSWHCKWFLSSDKLYQGPLEVFLSRIRNKNFSEWKQYE